MGYDYKISFDEIPDWDYYDWEVNDEISECDAFERACAEYYPEGGFDYMKPGQTIDGWVKNVQTEEVYSMTATMEFDPVFYSTGRNTDE